MVQPLWETMWQFLKKFNIELLYDPAIILLGVYLGELQTYIHVKIYTQMFTAALFIIAKM